MEPDKNAYRSVVGLFGGPLAFLASTQTSYALMEWQCTSGVAVTAIAALAFALLAGLSAAFSRPALSRPVDWAPGGRVTPFLASLSVGIGALSALAIVIHAIGGLIFSGCER